MTKADRLEQAIRDVLPEGTQKRVFARADEILGQRVREGGRNGGRPPRERGAAEQWVRQYLIANGRTRASQVLNSGAAAGHQPATLRRAANKVGVVRHPPGGGAKCTWELP